MTVQTSIPAIPVSASPAIGASYFLDDSPIPQGGHLPRSRPQHGRVFYISALFGARPSAPSLLRQTNQLLTSLTVT